jgi:hypothetical protein
MMFRRMLIGAVLCSLAFQPFALPPHAETGYFRDRDFFAAEVDDDFHLRGRCWVSKGKGGGGVDAANRLLKLTPADALQLPPGAKDIFPELGDAKCIVKKRVRAHGIRRASGTVITTMHSWAATPSGLQMARRTIETCTGKDRCDTTLAADGAQVVGLSACLEGRQGSDVGSHVITIGKVPAAIAAGKGYRDTLQCSARAF